MCDAKLSGGSKDCSRDIFSSHYFKSAFAKSLIVELTDKPALMYGSFQNENNGRPSISCLGDKGYQENERLGVITSASCRNLGRNLIRKQTDYEGKCHLRDRTTDLEKVGPWPREHRLTDHQQQRQHECTSTMEEGTPKSASQLRHIDTVILQSRVETLQWQLKQTEESRQMYRSLMEHVTKFLERVYTNLDELSRTEQCKSLPASVCNSPSHRVPRSQSALSVDATPSRRAARGNRDTVLNVSRAKSIAQIEESPAVFCDYTWRRSSKVTQHSDVTAQKLSQDAYRLLRTVQSLLNTNEPNLVHNVGVGDSWPESQRAPSRNGDGVARLSPDADSLQQSLQDLSLSRISPHGTPVDGGSKASWRASPALARSFSSLRRERGRWHQPLHSTLTLPKDSHPDVRLDSLPDNHLVVPHYTASLGRPKKLKESKLVAPHPECYVSDTPSEKQFSLSSNEDESGFSSMSSFQEVGLPLVPASSTPSPEDSPPYQQIGLPVFEAGDCVANHRRWSSVPADAHPHPQLGPVIPESISVMWV